MLDVSEATKALLKTDSVYKEMYVTIQNTGSPYIFENEDIYYEAFELKESILDGSDMTFMGCIASEMRITIRNRDNLKDYALNNRKITVEVTPYDRENTKNHLQSLFSAGDELEFNNVKMVVGDDLSLALTRSANADTVINVCDFMVDEDATWLLSGCPNGSAITNRLYGRLTVTNPTTGVQTVYNDIGSDVTIAVSRGNIIQYDIIIASGQSTGVTFYPMLRDTDASSEYEGYGTKLIEMDTIPLFTGYIDNGEYDKDKSWLKLTAYDVMYRLNTFNIWNWYNKVAFTQAEGADNKGQIALDDLLDSFASYVNTNSGYEFSLSSRCPVILSSIKIKKRLKNKEMTATNFLKSFCQLACACALINREGELQLIYRNAIITEEDTIRYYRSLTSKDYVITPFSEGITIRTNADDNGITLKHPAIDVETMPTASSSNEGTIVHYVGETTGSYVEGAYYICVEVDENVYEWQETDWDDDDDDTYVIDDDDEMVDYGNYFIEANGIVKKLSKNKRKSILNILLTYVQNSYYAFKAYNLECNGLPYVECGDDIICLDVSKTTHEDTVSGNSLSVNNTDGLEAPITFEFTFNAAEPVYTSIKTIGVFCNQYTGGGGSLGVNLLNVVTMLNDTYVHTGDMIILSKYDGVYDIRYRRKVDNSYIDYDISSCIENIGQSNAWNHDQYLKADTQMSYSITTSGYNVTVKATYDITVETTKLHVPIVNRTLKGIQAMVDIFSFELPDTTKQYGGTTDKKKIGEPENPGNIDKTSSSEDMIDIEFTENGTYSPYDYDVMGFSSVEVNVESGGGGDLGGSLVQATALQNISAWSCVGVNIGRGGNATIVSTNLPNTNVYPLNVGFGDGYIYYTQGPDTSKIYRLSLTNLNGTPELYLQTDNSVEINRNLVKYTLNGNLYYEDLNTNEKRQVNPYPVSTSIDNVSLPQEYVKLNDNNDPKLYKISPLQKMMDAAYGPGYPTSAFCAGYSLRNSYGSLYKQLFSSVSSYTEVAIDTTTPYNFSGHTTLIDRNIMLVHRDGTLAYSEYYNVGYTDLSLVTDADQNTSIIYQWNAEGTECYANLGSNGLAVFHSNMIYDLYANITNIDSSKCCMFRHYFWDGKQLWDLNPHNTMFLTNSKNGADMLGYVKDDVENNEIGTAFVLFS